MEVFWTLPIVCACLVLLLRYDDNIRFVKTELLPLLDAERSQMAEKYGGQWQVCC